MSRDAILQTSRRPYPQTFKKLGFYKTLSLCQETTSCRPVGVPILRLLKLGFWEKLESVSADANLRTSRGPYPKSYFQHVYLETPKKGMCSETPSFGPAERPYHKTVKNSVLGKTWILSPQTPSWGPAGGHILRFF